MPALVARRPVRTLEVGVRLETRQFGGGSETRQVDLDQWLRPAAVRGALRFWWRALYGHRFGDQMHAAEGEIFGAAATEKGAGPGKLSLSIEQAHRARMELEPWTPAQGDALASAYFPADLGNQRSELLLKPGATATIRLWAGPAGTPRSLGDEQWEQVRQALVALLVFGGSGARTRRAAGSLSFHPVAEARKAGGPDSLAALKEWLRRLPVAAAGQRRPEMFSLAWRDAIFIANTGHATGEAAQRHVLEMWRAFRQDRPHPPNWRGGANWGRSRWPEADALRFAHGMHARWADGTTHAPAPDKRGKAPRAHLGLPIIVKFKDDATGRAHDDRRGRRLAPEPPRSTLARARDGQDPDDRYASPIWLSVARVADQGSDAYRGIVLVTPSLLTGDVGILERPGARLDPGPWSEVKRRLFAALNQNFEQLAS